MSDEIATEIRSVLRRPKFSAAITPERFAEIVGLVFADAEWFYPTVRVTDCRDPKDNKYLELALEAGATLLVSSDNDLLSLGPWRDVQILRPAEYLAVYGALIGS